MLRILVGLGRRHLSQVLWNFPDGAAPLRELWAILLISAAARLWGSSARSNASIVSTAKNKGSAANRKIGLPHLQ